MRLFYTHGGVFLTMSIKQQKDPHQTSRDLLKTNTRVPKSVIGQYDELEGQLKKLGIEIKPHYTLLPIFGGGPFIKVNKRS